MISLQGVVINMSTEEEAYEDVLEFVEGQMEKLYEEEAFLNSKRDNDEFTEDGERAKWTYFQNFTESEQVSERKMCVLCC